MTTLRITPSDVHDVCESLDSYLGEVEQNTGASANQAVIEDVLNDFCDLSLSPRFAEIAYPQTLTLVKALAYVKDTGEKVWFLGDRFIPSAK